MTHLHKVTYVLTLIPVAYNDSLLWRMLFAVLVLELMLSLSLFTRAKQDGSKYSTNPSTKKWKDLLFSYLVSSLCFKWGGFLSLWLHGTVSHVRFFIRLRSCLKNIFAAYARLWRTWSVTQRGFETLYCWPRRLRRVILFNQNLSKRAYICLLRVYSIAFIPLIFKLLSGAQWTENEIGFTATQLPSTPCFLILMKKNTRTRLRFSVTIAVSFCYMFLWNLSKSSQLLSSNQG